MAASLSRNAPRSLRLLAALMLIGLCWLLPPCEALAQTIPGTAAPAAPKPTSADDIDKLIKTLDDPKARDQLKTQLQLLLKAQGGDPAKPGAIIEERGLGAQLLASISHHVESVSNTLVNLV